MRRHVTMGALLLLLAGCAGSRSGAVQPALLEVQYLSGVESDSARDLAGISDVETLPDDSAMQGALIAGDETFLVAATLFRRGDYYTLDMILLNRHDEPVRIDRSDVRLVDSKGRWLESISDWDGADRVGLRGKSRQEAPRFVYEAPAARNTSFNLVSYDPGRTGGTKGNGTPARMLMGPGIETPVAWRGDFEPVALPQADHVDVGAEEGKAYWVYWYGDEVEFPLTAFVMLDNRHVLFRFER